MAKKDSLMGEVISINISKEKGEVKKPVGKAEFIEDFGIRGDAHGGSAIKQVSLLPQEVIQKFEMKAGVDLAPGAFAENIVTKDINFGQLELGSRLQIGQKVLLEISQFGKKCPEGCAIKELTGECVMPTKGVFARVIRGGKVTDGDPIIFL